MKQPLAIQRVSVPAIIYANHLIVVDQRGRKLSQAIPFQQVIDDPDPCVLRRWLWWATVQRLQNTWKRQMERSQMNPWQKKAEILATSFRLRGYDVVRPHGRQRFEKYATTSWPEAACRLGHQISNRCRWRRRTGWERYAHSAANNHNKRKGGRYARNRYRDREANLGVD